MNPVHLFQIEPNEEVTGMMSSTIADPEERFMDACVSLLSLMPKRSMALMYRNASGNAFYLCGDGRILNRVGNKSYITDCAAEDVADSVRFFRMEPRMGLTEALDWAGLRIRQILEWPERHVMRPIRVTKN